MASKNTSPHHPLPLLHLVCCDVDVGPTSANRTTIMKTPHQKFMLGKAYARSSQCFEVENRPSVKYFGPDKLLFAGVLSLGIRPERFMFMLFLPSELPNRAQPNDWQ